MGSETQDRGWKKSGSVINIPDPQHNLNAYSLVRDQAPSLFFYFFIANIS
jgi:hypothetical protein